MATPDDFFKGIDFDKPWEEDDWERFFNAQERLSRELRVSPPSPRDHRHPGLGFREVMLRFGMNPDDPSSAPRNFDPPPHPTAAARFWEEGVEVEALPIFAHARLYARAVKSLIERRFPLVLFKTYSSKPHLLLQKILEDLQPLSVFIPGQIAAGHALGYRADRVKGNIVRCRRALTMADDCLGLVSRMPRRFLPLSEYKCLVSDTAKLRNALMAWIDLLRERFSGFGPAR